MSSMVSVRRPVGQGDAPKVPSSPSEPAPPGTLVVESSPPLTR